MTASVTVHDQTADWNGSSGFSRLCDYAVGDLLMMFYTVSGESSVTLFDDSWTQLYENYLGGQSPPQGLADSVTACWYKIADDAHSGADINGPAITPPGASPAKGAGNTIAFRISGAAAFPSVPVVLGGYDFANFEDGITAANQPTAHHTLNPPALNVGVGGGHYWMVHLALHGNGFASVAGFDAPFPSPMSLLENNSNTLGASTIEGVIQSIWRYDASIAGEATTFDPPAGTIGTSGPYQTSPSLYAIDVAIARTLCILAEELPFALNTCFELVGSRDDAAPSTQADVSSLYPTASPSSVPIVGDHVLVAILTRLRDDNAATHNVIWASSNGFAPHADNGSMRTGEAAGDIDLQLFYRDFGTGDSSGDVLEWTNTALDPDTDELADVFLVTKVYRGGELLTPVVSYDIVADAVTTVDHTGGLTVTDSLVSYVVAACAVGAEGTSFVAPSILWTGGVGVDGAFNTLTAAVGDDTFGRYGPATQLPDVLATADGVFGSGVAAPRGVLTWSGETIRSVWATVSWLKCSEDAYWGILATP